MDFRAAEFLKIKYSGETGLGGCAMSKRLIDLQHITKSYDGQVVLDDLNLYIRENEFLTLLASPP